MSSILLDSKLHPPGLRSGVVPRPRLTEAVAASGVPIVVVVAPPGFGKTMLLAEWERLDDRPFAWVSLDRRDNDPLLLWSYVVAAIGRIAPDFARVVEPVLNTAGSAVLDAVIPRILSEIELLDREIVVVLDDYHWLTNEACHASLGLWVEHRPPNAQLVLGSRFDPPLSLARLRANGELFELRARQLAFTEDETASVLGRESGVDLPADAVAVLHRRTEGWPAGVYLALLSLRGATDPAKSLSEFDGSSRHVADYLTEVVLESRSEQHRSFLLETSILERMCASLCAAVTGRTDSARLLAEIEHANLFLVGLDGRREWFRYHHLFGELLSDALRRRDPGSEVELHRRACQWYGAAGYIDEAIEHAIRGSDLDAAATLIGTHWNGYIRSGRVATLTRWLEFFPPAVRRTDARLAIAEAWTLAMFGSFSEAQQALDAASEAGYEGELPDGTGTLSESINQIRATFTWSDAGAMLTAARAAYATEQRRRSAWQPLASFNLGWALILAGSMDEAVAPMEQAAALASHHEAWVIAADSRGKLAKIALASGDLARAQAWMDEAFALARTHGFVDLPHVGFYYTVSGAIQASLGDLKQADESLGRALQQMRNWEPLSIAEALLERALVRSALGARTEARAMLSDARALIERCPDPGVLSQRLDAVTRKLTAPSARTTPDSLLTERELEVLRLLARGLTKREVSAELFLSYSTIHSHTKAIYRKLDGRTRDEVLEHARERDIIPTCEAQEPG